MKLIILISCWIVIYCQLSNVNGECCEIMMGCAGCGPCNIFCCNCDNGCNLHWHSNPNRLPAWWYYEGHVKRCGHWNKREMSNNTETKYWRADKRFKEIDIDGSNDISIHEANNYLKNNTRAMKRETFLLEKEFA